MGETTSIEWTATRRPDGAIVPGATFNPWWGCTKVSQGCARCYAETLAKRTGSPELWGPQGVRRRTSAANWREPPKWNRLALEAGVRRKVFCASMADVFEDRTELAPWRADLFALIEATPALDWLLLTKRPENVAAMVPARWMAAGFPQHVWMGASVEHQDAVEERVPHLVALPARVRFLSMEPLLGRVSLLRHMLPASWVPPRIHWVIVGGESGAGARPMAPEWAQSLRDQCLFARVSFFFKQWGGTNKKAAGRLLDGREWNGMPLSQ